MSEDQFERERLYEMTVTIARSMHEKGLITAEELRLIYTMMCDKYEPLLGALCRPEMPKLS